MVYFSFQALVAEIEQNQTKLDECQTHSKQYCTSVKVKDDFRKHETSTVCCCVSKH